MLLSHLHVLQSSGTIPGQRLSRAEQTLIIRSIIGVAAS